jgi:predicted transcriptional regulator
MTIKGRETLAIQMYSEILRKLREIARTEDRPLQALIDEALSDLIQKRKEPRAYVMATYQSSHEKFRSLYTKLAE